MTPRSSRKGKSDATTLGGKLWYAAKTTFKAAIGTAACVGLFYGGVYLASKTSQAGSANSYSTRTSVRLGSAPSTSAPTFQAQAQMRLPTDIASTASGLLSSAGTLVGGYWDSAKSATRSGISKADNWLSDKSAETADFVDQHIPPPSGLPSLPSENPDSFSHLPHSPSPQGKDQSSIGQSTHFSDPVSSAANPIKTASSNAAETSEERLNPFSQNTYHPSSAPNTDGKGYWIVSLISSTFTSFDVSNADVRICSITHIL